MSELFYTLRLIILNFEEIIGIIGIAMLLFGIVNAFFGYKWFKFMLKVMGFLFGALVGYILFINSRSSIADSNAALGYILIGGFIGSAVAEIFHSLGVFIAVGTMGIIIFFLMTQNADSALVIGVICGIVGVFIEKYCIIITTALSGGYLAAAGIWFLSIAKGNNANIQAIGWLIGILGFLFQLWSERRKPREAGEDTRLEDIADTVIVLISVPRKLMDSAKQRLRLWTGDPRTAKQKLFYKKGTEEIKSVWKSLTLCAPFIIGMILGMVFHSLALGFIVILALDILFIALAFRIRKLEVLSGGYIPKNEWEKWLYKVLKSLEFCVFMFLIVPVFVGFSIMMASLALTDNELISILLFLAGAGGTGIIIWKATDKLPDEAANFQRTEERNIEKQQSSIVGMKENSANNHVEENTVVCTNCGKMIKADANFCGSCGKKQERKNS